MPDLSFSSLAVVLAVAFVTPLALGLCPGCGCPSVVVEIVLGIVIGPSVLGWAEPDEVVKTLSVVGLAFLLFLAGLELDLTRLRGRTLRLTSLGFALSLALATVCGFGLSPAGLVKSPLLAAVILTATSLGPGAAGAEGGRARVDRSRSADHRGGVDRRLRRHRPAVAAVLPRRHRHRRQARAAARVRGAGRGARRRRSRCPVAAMRVSALLVRLQDTTAEIRVRGAVLLLIVVIVLAQHFGLETILGAFVAGAVVGWSTATPRRPIRSSG